MGRKKDIEGQLNFLDMLMAGAGDAEEEQVTSSVNYKAGGFKECASCWCATCEHSTLGGSVPRPLGDGMQPCPACELCIRAGKAEICVIGSADEGCRHRAEKEGLV